MTVRMPAVRKPRLIGFRAFVSPSLALHGEDADDRGEHADGASGEREHEAERRVGADGRVNAATPRMIEATRVTS